LNAIQAQAKGRHFASDLEHEEAAPRVVLVDAEARLDLARARRHVEPPAVDPLHRREAQVLDADVAGGRGAAVEGPPRRERGQEGGVPPQRAVVADAVVDLEGEGARLATDLDRQIIKECNS
jgi:hypothetical protein